MILLGFVTVVLVIWIVWPEKKTDLPGVFRVGMIVVLLVVTVAFVLGQTIANCERFHTALQSNGTDTACTSPLVVTSMNPLSYS